MFNQAENTVVIEGTLSELDLNYGSYTKNGRQIDMINGTITIRVRHETMILEIPVSVFANKITSRGSANPAYVNLDQAMKTLKSIAAVGEENADCVRMTGCRVTMNEYFSNIDGHLVSFPRITGSFVNRVNKADLNERATFTVVMVIKNLANEVDASGVETGRLEIEAYVPKYGNNIDVMKFYAENENVIDVITQNWDINATVRAMGRVCFTARTEKTQSNVDFGEPVMGTRTIRVSELIITGGTQVPLEGELAYTEENIEEGLATRAAALENLKSRMKPAAKRPTPVANKYGF